MADFDRLSATIVTRYGNATFNNIVYGQVTDEALPGATLLGFANLIDTNFVDNHKATTVDSFSYVAIVVRKLKPAITDVFVKNITKAGDLPQSGLPGTCYTLLRYFSQPYEKGSAFHWKLSGLPDDANVRGLMTNQAVTRYTALITAITGGPIVSDGNTYSLIRPPKSTDAPGVQLPEIYKSQVDNTIRNLRSRQVRL